MQILGAIFLIAIVCSIPFIISAYYKNVVQDKIDEMGGEIVSIKEVLSKIG